MRARVPFVLLLVVLAVPAAAAAAAPQAPTAASMADAVGFRLLRALSDAAPGEDVSVSPVSLAATLAVAWDGAGGATRRALGKALGLRADAAGEATRAAWQDLRAGLESAPPATVLMATGLWTPTGVALLPDFVARAGAAFGATTGTFDPGDPAAAARQVNEWAAGATRGLVPEALSPAAIRPEVALLLVNATYFEASWRAPFDPERTQDEDFRRSDGSTVRVPMMRHEGYFRYAQTGPVQLLALPYAGDRFVLYVVLPGPRTKLASVLRGLTPQRFRSWVAKLAEHEGYVRLPRFRLDHDSDLAPALTAMGAGALFRKPDLSGMTAAPTAAVGLRQRAVVDVGERGTVAAAVTGLMATMNGGEKFEFYADRPFLFAIVDGETDALYFLGAVHFADRPAVAPTRDPARATMD